MPVPILIAASIFVALCAITDVRERRIPNLLSGCAVVGGTLINAWYGGGAGALASLAGIALGGGLLLAPFALGGVGAGDVKMMGALGALLGPRLALLGGLLGMALGGVFMLAHLLRVGRCGEILARLAAMIRGTVVTRSVASLRVSADTPGAITLPYSVPLGLGTALALLLAA
jgi:prepilin peptidase CpaA